MKREDIIRVTLFVPGAPPSVAAWNGALRREGLRIEAGALRGDGLDASVQVEWVENDGGFGRAFSFGTVESGELRAIEAAPGALVAHWPIDLRDGRKQMLAVVERLRDAGALAVRIEQSKLGWGVSRWLELLSSPFPGSWHRAAVTLLSGDGALQSCGMHAFSLPDVRVPLESDPPALHELASAFNVYQLAEDPLIRSGQTFSPAPGMPRRVMERWPDIEYPAEHACHNPYGVWRLGPPGGAARSRGALVPTFMPALRVVLAALEAKSGRPLTRAQVEAARDRSACVALEPRDAQQLERRRGYSDIDPELAWEQWCLVRSVH